MTERTEPSAGVAPGAAPVSLDALRAGEPEALEVFWMRFRPDVERLGRKLLDSDEEAGELADEVLVDFVDRYVERLRTPAACWTYLRLMTTRRAIRRRKRQRKHDEEPLGQLADEDHVSADERAAVTLLLPRLDHCLDELTPKARQMIRLRFRSEWTNARIARAMSISKQYVGRVITKSLGALRACLERGAVEVTS